MKWFRGKTKYANAEPDPLSIKIDDTKVFLDELQEETEAKITRTDYHKALLDSLILLHPEVRDQPPMIEFVSRLQKYLQEHPGQKGNP